MKSLALGSVLLSLAACGSLPEYGPESPYYRYPAGMRLQLNQSLEIPPHSATLRLQFGRIVPRNGVHEEEPHCIFEIDTVADTPQRVAADNFAVVRVTRSTWTSHHGTSDRALALRLGSADDASPSFIFYITEFRLRSSRQPDVRALTCQSNQYVPGVAIMRHLTLAEIGQAVGGYFTLHIPK